MPLSPSRTRRSFLQAFGAGVLGVRGSFVVAAEKGEELVVPMLGDLHFDKPEHHDLEWLRASHVGDERQIENYCRVTREWSPKLLEVARQRVAEGGEAVPFLLQLGDLIQGLCGNAALAERHMREAVDWVKGDGKGAPFAMCKGNHDVTGPGAKEAYEKLLVPFLQQRINEAGAARFARVQGGTMFVFFDAYDKGSLEWFERLMAESKPARLVFILHPPVVPYNARATWHVFAKPADAEKRERLLDLLWKHRAIVLCGHLHKYSCVARRTKTGSFVQLAISSVATDEEARPKDERTGLDAYGPDLVTLEPNHAPETVEDRRRLLEAERKFITHYDYASTWGHAVLRISRDGAKASVCRGLSKEAWREVDLAALVGA
jgi:hypothetical protein